jgi:hypothetical protein
MVHIAKMLGSGSIDESTAVTQVLQLADGTLKGNVHDSIGLFPTFKAISDQRTGTAVVDYTEEASNRARNMLEAIAIMFGEKDRSIPLRERFRKAVVNAGKIAHRERAVREIVQQYISDSEMYGAHRFGGAPKSSWSITTADFNDNAMARQFTDILTGRVGQFGEWHKDKDTGETGAGLEAEEDESHTGIINRGSLMLHGGTVPPQIDRTYVGTHHVSRSMHSPFARLDMPANLQVFVDRWNQRHRRERLMLADPSTIFTP